MQGVISEFKFAFSNIFRGKKRWFDSGYTNVWGFEGLKYVLMKKCSLGPFGILLPICLYLILVWEAREFHSVVQ
ncbi:hypothetical protein PGTUg99_021073 [Puccinia graminis f. sp. tritici]|uniref:Uncharacterized protein n=1 Tax=Puccinia graminis f. sp. tritici TaxID=56615 RepID=A0A5B0RUP7_PUCGR|nr:hypothetical protein PGTUg99_021073 [Puccinia graminis f. sp. tritici]